MQTVDPRSCSESGQSSKEEAKEQYLAGEPGAPPHLKSTPGIGGTSKMKHRDVERKRGEREDERKSDGTVVMREQCGNESSRGELDE